MLYCIENSMSSLESPQQNFALKLQTVPIVKTDQHRNNELDELPIYHEITHALALYKYVQEGKAIIKTISFGQNSGHVDGLIDKNMKEEISLTMLGGPLTGNYATGYKKDVADILRLCKTSDTTLSALEKARNLALTSIDSQGGPDIAYALTHAISVAAKDVPSGEFSISGEEFGILLKKVQENLGKNISQTRDTKGSDELIKKIAQEPLYFSFRTPKDGGKSEIRLVFGKNALDKKWKCEHGIGNEDATCPTCRGQEIVQPLHVTLGEQSKKTD